MSVSVLLRVLLCLLLVLNGTGTAVAAAQMAVEHAAPDCHSAAEATGTVVAEAAGPAMAAHHSATGSTQPCHDSTQATRLADLAQPPLGDADGGCCDSEQCACLQQLLATTSPAPSPAATPGTRPANGHPRAGHIPPSLAHLIRPPIG